MCIHGCTCIMKVYNTIHNNINNIYLVVLKYFSRTVGKSVVILIISIQHFDIVNKKKQPPTPRTYKCVS